jgi:uncharacterized protein (UPF0332 family)
MANGNHLEEARKLYQKASEEFEKAKKKSDGVVLRDACAKGWLSALEATYALLIKKSVKEEELPKRGDRGRRYMVYKYAGKELELLYFSLRNTLHIEGYYDGALDFDEVERHFGKLNSYIREIEELKQD